MGLRLAFWSVAPTRTPMSASLHLWPVTIPYRTLAYLDATDSKGRSPVVGAEIREKGALLLLRANSWHSAHLQFLVNLNVYRPKYIDISVYIHFVVKGTH